MIEFEKINFEVEERNDELFLIFFMFKLSGEKIAPNDLKK